MTKPIGGEVIEPATRPDLLAPGTVRRPPWISEADWARMPWPAQWRAAKRATYTTTAGTTSPQVSTGVHGPYRGGTTPTQPCGTYAAYQRHKRAGQTPCRACLDANNDRWRERRINLGLPVKRDTFDAGLVARFVRDEVPWDELSVAERIDAARRMDAGGISRAEIARRTRLNGANLRRAFASTELSTVLVDEIPCAAQAVEQAG